MRFRAILGALALAAGPLTPISLAAPPAVGDLVKPALYAESATVAPGRTLWLDLNLAIAPGWHIYWRNPGDSGLPTTIDWTLPPGFTAGDIEWPVPERFKVGDIANYGYADGADLLVPIATPAALDPGGPAPIAAKVAYLVCAEICIPGTAQVTLDLAMGPGEPEPRQAARFAAVRERLPIAAPFRTVFKIEGSKITLTVDSDALAGLDHAVAMFFPDNDNVIDHSAAQSSTPRGGGLDLTMVKSAGPTAATPVRLDGVLVLTGADKVAHGYTIDAEKITPLPTGFRPSLRWNQALAFAFLGGLILNLMPCVFPILSLKVLSFATVPDPARRHHHGIAYAIGVMASFAVLGGAILGLRAGGMAVGWGFQLQSPVVVGLLAYLMLAMALSLSGVAEFGVGLSGIGGKFAARGGVAGAFFTGVLATVVATPCTAPFMGAALGAALVMPPPLALGVFIALGAGLAAPLAIASFIPAVARVLPRPGRWMEVLKQVLALPLYGTVAWLIWVVIQEVGPEGSFPALLGLMLTGLAVWLYGHSRFAAPPARRLGGALTVVALAGALALAIMLPRTGAAASTPAQDALPYEKFSEARIYALTTVHKPVFVNLTAAWCITCLVNERATLARAAVRDTFAAHGVVAMKGDWTHQDPEIAQFLEGFGRSGVPLYVLYDGNGTATVLPQILTEGAIIDAVAKL